MFQFGSEENIRNQWNEIWKIANAANKFRKIGTDHGNVDIYKNGRGQVKFISHPSALGNKEYVSSIIFNIVTSKSLLKTEVGFINDAARSGRVFWAGGEEAMDLATDQAMSEGQTTLGMTRAGQNLQNLITTRNIPWNEARPM